MPDQHRLHYIKLTLTTVLLLSGQTVFSETVYVCKGEGKGGSPLYSDKPCKSGQGETIDFPDTYTVGEGLSELERKHLSEIEAREREQRSIKLTPTEEEVKTTTAASDTKIDKKACKEATDSLKEWQRIMYLGYLPEQEETVKKELQYRINTRHEACGEQE